MMPLLNVELPPLCGIFFGFLMKIAAFDPIPIDNYLDEYTAMTPRNPINTNFEAIGFESMYVIINLGSMLFLFVLFPILAILEIIMRIIPTNYTKKGSNYLRRTIYWNSSIRLFKESYAIALMCALINMKAISAATFWELFSVILALLIIFLAITVPIVLVINIRRNFHRLKQDKVFDVIGASYDHMRLEDCNESETVEDLW